MHGTQPDKRFAEWLQERLGDRTQGQVAEYVGVAKSTVNRWLSGVSVPKRRNIKKLAAYLKVEPAEIEALLPEPPEEDFLPPNSREFIRQVVEEVARLSRGEPPQLPVYPTEPGADTAPMDPASFRALGSRLTRGRMRAIQVASDDVYPRLERGWIVWVNPENAPEHGDVVAIGSYDEPVLREYEERPDGVYLTARRQHAPLKYDPETTALLGVIVLVQHSP